MAEVVLDSVSKLYDRRVHAVRGVSLRVADGEFVVLVGPSGCGKSTTLRMIAGLEDISEGTISIGGRVVNQVHPKDRDIAMVFQNYALYPHMTVRENMAFALTLRKVPRDQVQARVTDAARLLGIEELLERKPAALSGGQRQRVAVGRAIVREPKAFLFDEPLSNLDARLRVTMRGELKALHQRLRTTTIYVTHDQEEAMTLGDRVVVMADGVVHQAGPPLAVYRAPANRFVASFIGTPPMNFLTGRLKPDGTALLFVEGSNDPTGRPYVYRLPAKANAPLREHLNAEVLLGIRPQAFRDPTPAEEKDPGLVWKLPVRLVEPLGEQMDLTCATGKNRLLARVSSRSRAGAGGVATLAIDPGGVHVFSSSPASENLLRDLA